MSSILFAAFIRAGRNTDFAESQSSGTTPAIKITSPSAGRNLTRFYSSPLPAENGAIRPVESKHQPGSTQQGNDRESTPDHRFPRRAAGLESQDTTKVNVSLNLVNQRILAMQLAAE